SSLMNGESPTDRSVLVTLFDHSPLTRPELAAHTGLSRPTISDAVRRLGDAGLILEAGQRRGGLGRVPTMYRLAPTAGYVLAVDIGGDNTRVAVADLAGTVHVEQRRATHALGATRVAAQAARMMRHAVREAGHRFENGKQILAAEAGTYGVLAALRARRTWPGRRPATVAELFAQAADGLPDARELVDAEAHQLGLTVAGACAVFDPDLVVLGGGIGSNALLLPAVRETVSALVPFPPRVESSALGEVASLTGALSIALAGARDGLLAAVATSGEVTA